MHNSQIYNFGGLYNRLGVFLQRYGERVVVNSAFCTGHFLYFVKSAEEKSASNKPEECYEKQQLWDKRPSGHAQISGKLPWNEEQIHLWGEWGGKVVLSDTVLLFIICSRLVGINQTQYTYIHAAPERGGKVFSLWYIWPLVVVTFGTNFLHTDGNEFHHFIHHPFLRLTLHLKALV